MNRYPTNAAEYQVYEDRLRKKREKTDIVYMQRGDGGSSMWPQETRLRPLMTGSPNWNNAPYRGYNMDQMHTYQIPRADVTQKALFDKYILGNSNARLPDYVSNVQEAFFRKNPTAKQKPYSVHEMRNSARQLIAGNNVTTPVYGQG